MRCPPLQNCWILYLLSSFPSIYHHQHASLISLCTLPSLYIFKLQHCKGCHEKQIVLFFDLIALLSPLIAYPMKIQYVCPVNMYFICTLSDNQAIRHCHCTNTWSPPPPHHADHGLRAAALPEASQPSEDRSREELQHAVLAGVPKAHDSWKLLGESAGTLTNIRCSELIKL